MSYNLFNQVHCNVKMKTFIVVLLNCIDINNFSNAL